jgi:hypothetical protein
MDDRPAAVLNAEINLGVAKLIAGNADACWQKLDDVVAKAKKQGTGQRFGTPGFKARLMTREGNAAAAEKLVRSDLAQTQKADLPDGFRTGITRFLLGEEVRASAYAGHADEAAKALAQLEEASKTVSQVAFNASLLKNARGLVALARGDAKAAVEEMRGCTDADFNCQYDLVHAQEKAGDGQGAAATREALFKVPRRGIEYVYLWKKLGGRPAARVAAKPQGE